MVRQWWSPKMTIMMMITGNPPTLCFVLIFVQMLHRVSQMCLIKHTIYLYFRWRCIFLGMEMHLPNSSCPTRIFSQSPPMAFLDSRCKWFIFSFPYFYISFSFRFYLFTVFFTQEEWLSNKLKFELLYIKFELKFEFEGAITLNFKREGVSWNKIFPVQDFFSKKSSF